MVTLCRKINLHNYLLTKSIFIIKKILFLFFFGACFLAANAQAPWRIDGNSDINPGYHFLGTTNANPIIFKTNNTERMRLLPDKPYLGIGTPDPEAMFHLYVENDLGADTIQNYMLITNSFNVKGKGIDPGEPPIIVAPATINLFSNGERDLFFQHSLYRNFYIGGNANGLVITQNEVEVSKNLNVDEILNAQSANISNTLTSNVLNAQSANITNRLTVKNVSAQNADIANILIANILNTQSATIADSLSVGSLIAASASISGTAAVNTLSAQSADIGTFTNTLNAPAANITGAVNASSANINGVIRTMEVNVTTSGWPDFVFSKDYKLMPLSEVEQFITENQHLPNVPAETEVLTNGINVGEMNALLLQKVEELTLYIIALQKQMDELKKQ